jgi:hypothetical protein
MTDYLLLSEFQTLCELRELALLNLLGVVQHAAASLNLNDPPAALKTLMRGLEMHNRADRAITDFYARQPVQLKGESHVDAIASHNAA